MFRVEKTPGDRADERIARMDWPDGPVCPFCGGRERVNPEIDGERVRVRYECVGCGRHHGYIRHRSRDPRYPSRRRPILPRDPDRGR